MSEKAYSVQRSVRVGKFTLDERLCLKLVAVAITVALALAVIMLRFQRLDELPPGLFSDEAKNGVGALRVLQGEHAIFFPNIGDGREPSVVYALAMSTLLFGRTLLATRLPTALGSAAMVFATFWIGRLFFGRDEESGRATPWRGLLIGGIGAGLMAVSISHTILGRTAYSKATFMPPLLCLSLGLLWWGWKERSWWRIGLAGACTGLLPYTYMSARIVPFLIVLFGLSFLLPLRSVSWEKVRAELPWAAAFVGVAGLVSAPLLVYFALHPEHFFLRSQKLWVFDPVHSQGSPLGAFVLNVWDHLLALGFRGDPHPRGNYAGQPILNPWQAFFFGLGAVMTVLRWRRSTYRLLLLWLTIMIVPSLLARSYASPTNIRMIGTAPAIYLLAGVGVWEAFRFLRERFSHKSEIWTATVVGVVITALILVQGVGTYRTYFQKWAVEYDLHDIYDEDWVDLAAAMNAQPSTAGTVYLIPAIHSVLYNYESFKYLYTGATPVYFFDRTAPDLAQMLGSTLEALEDVSTVKVVEGKSTPDQVGEDNGRFAFLLSKYGSYQGSEEYPIFTIHNYSDIHLDRPWTFYETPEPLTVDYDGGIALGGVALGQGEDQLSSRQALDLGRDRPLWMALQWQIAPGLDVDFAISLRLYNEEGARVYQEDSVLWNPRHFPTSYWSAEAPVETLALLAVPADLPYGDYELRVVVYDFETQVPTVQESVWEPELTLARLRLAEVQ